MTPSDAAIARGMVHPGLVTMNPIARDQASRVACIGTCVLVLAMPFETREPLLRLPGQEFSSAELVLLAVVGAWIALSASSGLVPRWRTPLTVPWIMFLLAMLLAAAVSSHRANALHMVGRLMLGYAVYVTALNGVTTPARRRAVMMAIGAAGALAGVLVVLEYLGVSPVIRGLRLFRSDVALVGAQVRAGGPFQYPTIAAMYLEVAFALVLGLMLIALDKGRRGLAALGAVAALLIAESIALTFTRAGLLAMASSLGFVGWRRYRQRGIDRGVQAIAAIALLVAVQLLTSRSMESLRLRLTTEGQDYWYRADVEAPRDLTMAARTRMFVPVTLTNSGGNTWDPWAAHPFHLSYHWLLPDSDRVVSWEGLRTPFPEPVPPGATVTLQALVEAPFHPGTYRILWDIEQEHRLWFSTEPDATLAFSRATITGTGGPVGPISTIPLPTRAVRPSRLVLWRAAARMVRDHPLLGVGPDNYRLLYGGYAGLFPANPRIHSNNMYLEVLAGGGLLGGLAFMWLVWKVTMGVRSRLRTVEPAESTAMAGIVAAVVAIALHGLFDSFLSFTPTYVIISVSLALASPRDALDISHANRV